MVSNRMNLESLMNNFTDDAWYLIEAYFAKLDIQLHDSQLSERKQLSILSGLEDYLCEYIDDYKGRTKISFKLTLKLLEEIGSPHEIIQTLDISHGTKVLNTSSPTQSVSVQPQTTYTARIVCRNCHYSLAKGSLFCDNCGYQLTRKSPSMIVPQIIIDHSYLTSFVISWIAIALFVLSFKLNTGRHFIYTLFPDITITSRSTFFVEFILLTASLSDLFSVCS